MPDGRRSGRPLSKTVPEPDPRLHREAACRGKDPNLFFPIEYVDPKAGRFSGRGLSPTAKEAVAICGQCDVRILCRDYAAGMKGIVMGIWGGLTPHQLAEFKKERRRRGSPG